MCSLVARSICGFHLRSWTQNLKPSIHTIKFSQKLIILFKISKNDNMLTCV